MLQWITMPIPFMRGCSRCYGDPFTVTLNQGRVFGSLDQRTRTLYPMAPVNALVEDTYLANWFRPHHGHFDRLKTVDSANSVTPLIKELRTKPHLQWTDKYRTDDTIQKLIEETLRQMPRIIGPVKIQLGSAG